MDIETARTKLKGSPYENCVEQDNDGAWLRVDTDDNDPKEAWTEYCFVLEDLREHGLALDEAQLEHDCISGTLIEYSGE